MSNETHQSNKELEAERDAALESLKAMERGYQQMSITVDSLKQHVFDLNMQLVDKNSELMIAQGQMRELQVSHQVNQQALQQAEEARVEAILDKEE